MSLSGWRNAELDGFASFFGVRMNCYDQPVRACDRVVECAETEQRVGQQPAAGPKFGGESGKSAAIVIGMNPGNNNGEVTDEVKLKDNIGLDFPKF